MKLVFAFILGFSICLALVFFNFGHYKDPVQKYNDGYTMAGRDIFKNLESNFGIDGKIPNSELEIDKGEGSSIVFSVKSGIDGTVYVTKINGIPTLYLKK